MTAAASSRPSRIVQRTQWGVWLFSALVLILLSVMAFAAVRHRILDVTVFLTYLTSGEILQGALNALVLGTLSLALAAVIGFVIALMRLSGAPVLEAFAGAYVYFFRGTPMLIQLLFWFNAFPTMFPRLHLSLPVSGTVFVDAPMSSVVTPFLAALAALALAEGAYMGEIIRGGILAVDKGQQLAAKALGMTRWQVMVHIVTPQAGRIIIPAGGNEYITLIKSTSLASTIGYLELLRVASNVYSSNFRVVELIAVAAFWYLVMTAFATALQNALEKAFPQR